MQDGLIHLILVGVTTKSAMLDLIARHGPLTDAEIARHLGVVHQHVNQAARGLAARGEIDRVPDPHGVIVNHLVSDGEDLRRPQNQHRSGTVPTTRRRPVLGPVATGTPIDSSDLRGLGFVEHGLDRVPSADVPEHGLIGWNTLGVVPDSPGIYCFVGRRNRNDDARVFYVGMTRHLWMVTRGRLPGGIARGGQRYGRPKHAGTTRQRVNGEVARLTAVGWTFSHWLQPVTPPPRPIMLDSFLLDCESRFITEWALRDQGWNRR